MGKQMVRLDPDTLELTPVAGNHNDLKTLQGLVGGLIELVRGDQGIDVWIDEEGRLKDLLPSAMIRHRLGYSVSVRGPVVFVVPRSTSPEDSIARVQRMFVPLQWSQSTESAPPPPSAR